MKTNITVWFIFLWAILFLGFVGCTDISNLDGQASTQCNIVDLKVEVLDNGGLVPMPAKERAMKREALMFRLSFATSSTSNNTLYKLNDGIKAIQIVSRTNLNTEVIKNTDITSFFQIINRGTEPLDLTSYSASYFANTPLDIVLFMEADAGVHEFEVRLILDSGYEITKQVKAVELE